MTPRPAVAWRGALALALFAAGCAPAPKKMEPFAPVPSESLSPIEQAVRQLENRLSEIAQTEKRGSPLCVGFVPFTTAGGDETDGTRKLTAQFFQEAGGSARFVYRAIDLDGEFGYLRAKTAGALDANRYKVILGETGCWRVVSGAVQGEAGGAVLALSIHNPEAGRAANVALGGFTPGAVVRAYEPAGRVYVTDLKVFLIKGPNSYEGTEGQSSGGGGAEEKPAPATPQPAPAAGGGEMGGLMNMLPFLAGVMPSMSNLPNWQPSAEVSPDEPSQVKPKSGSQRGTGRGATVAANFWALTLTLNGKKYVDNNIVTRFEGDTYPGPNTLYLVNHEAVVGQTVHIEVSFFSKIHNETIKKSFEFELGQKPAHRYYIRFDAQYGIDLLEEETAHMQF